MLSLPHEYQPHQQSRADRNVMTTTRSSLPVPSLSFLPLLLACLVLLHPVQATKEKEAVAPVQSVEQQIERCVSS